MCRSGLVCVCYSIFLPRSPEDSIFWVNSNNIYNERWARVFILLCAVPGVDTICSRLTGHVGGSTVSHAAGSITVHIHSLPTFPAPVQVSACQHTKQRKEGTEAGRNVMRTRGKIQILGDFDRIYLCPRASEATYGPDSSGDRSQNAHGVLSTLLSDSSHTHDGVSFNTTTVAECY